jgi:gamma-glutamyl hydrolase
MAEPVVIGMVAHPTTETETTGASSEDSPFVVGSQYIASSYIQWIEQAGGRVIGVPFNATRQQTRALFEKMNGVHFPGGATPVGGSARLLYELAEESNANGNFFPVWGTCLGFQWLMQLGSTNESAALCYGCFDAANKEDPLDLMAPVAASSRLLGSLPPELLALAGSEPITFNNHHDGIRPEAFASDPALSSNWSVLSTNMGRDGAVYISTIEAKRRPYYGIQWHAEKSQFEYYPSRVNHSADAIRLSTAMAKFFIEEARRSRPPPSIAVDADFTSSLPISRGMLPFFQAAVLVIGAERPSTPSASTGTMGAPECQITPWVPLFGMASAALTLALLALCACVWRPCAKRPRGKALLK